MTQQVLAHTESNNDKLKRLTTATAAATPSRVAAAFQPVGVLLRHIRRSALLHFHTEFQINSSSS